jgi:uncharacterized membrane protein
MERIEIKKTTKPLILISIVAIVFNLARLDLWGTSNLLYLIWNLFLAWVPYIITLFFVKKEMSVNRFIPVFLVWLLFIPNAPYLVTDVLHIVSSSPALLWYDSLLFFFFGWIGLFLGIFSLFHVHQYFKAHLNYLLSEISVFCICFVSSFGIYLGRFERWNSWDLLIHPLVLTRRLFYLSINLTHTGTPLLFVIFFTVFLYSVYKTMYVFLS